MQNKSVILFFGLVLTVTTLPGEEIRMARHPELSADGSTLYFAWRNQLWSAASTGGDAVPLTANPAADHSPKVSPDGKHLAFISERTGSAQIFVMPATGGVPRQLTEHTEGYRIEGWYPDGSQLLASGNRDHFWRFSQRFFPVPVEGQFHEHPLFDAYGYDASMSADAKHLLFVREGERWWRKGYRGPRAAQIWKYEIEKNRFTKVLAEDAECRSPLWKPDGTGFYYVSNREGSFNLWEHDMTSGESRQLTTFRDDSVHDPCLSQDGKVIVFRHLFDLYRLSTEPAGPPRKIALADNGDHQADEVLRRTLTTAGEASFSRDGLEIAVIAGGDVWVMDTTLREPVQITNTPEFESDPVFSHDHNTIYFVSVQDGNPDLFKAVRGDESKYWWQNETFNLTRLTNDPASEFGLSLTPDGKHLAFEKERGDLWLMHTESGKLRRLASSFLPVSYSFSHDSQWIAYSRADNDFNSDIWIEPVDGSADPVNVSRHPDNESNPVWSADGSLLAFSGRRMEDEVDIYYLWLQNSDEDRTSRARKLQSAVGKMKGRKLSTPEKSEDAATNKPQPEKEESAKPARMPIDFANIHDRLHRISIPNSSESGLLFSPKGRKLAFSAEIAGKSGTYTVDFPDQLTPKLLSTTTGSGATWLPNNSIAWLVRGVPSTLSSTGAATTYSFRALQEVRHEDRHRAIFETSWRAMRDWWYDDRFNNRNWDQIRRKYTDMAATAHDMETLADLISMMLGELNGSHLGFRAGSSRPDSSNPEWSVSTAHLGLRFDLDFKGPGLRIRDVIPEGPTDKSGTEVAAGEILLSVDGKSVDPAMNLTGLLTGRMDRDILLKIRAADSEEEREISVRPISYSAARTLLYQKWISDNAAMVERLSEGTMGYLHIRAMDWPSFLEFERELYNVGYGKKGLVIDVRENGGGFTTDHLLTALTQPRHAVTVPRGGGPGYPHDRMVYATWDKPIVVMCNQNSFSNAEIFSHAIKNLKRGRVVGVRTAGGVISTGSTRIMDVGILRRPFRAWFVKSTGLDMELNGAVPDIEVWPSPGDWPAGIDKQIETAVETLGKDIRRYEKRPVPELKYASEIRAEQDQ